MREQRRILRPRQRSGFTMSHAAMKCLGWMCTLAAVAATAVYGADEVSTMKMVLLLTSYVALPIFAFLTVEGVLHTSNCGKYILRTLIAAVVAEPFYDFVRTGSWFAFIGENGQNVLFSIAVAQVMVYFLKRTEQGKLWGMVLKVILVAAGLFWAVLMQSQYGGPIILFTAICYFARNNKALRGALIIMYSIFSYYTPAIAVLFINRYDGERGNYNRNLFYVLFPAMWAFIAILRLFGF